MYMYMACTEGQQAQNNMSTVCLVARTLCFHMHSSKIHVLHVIHVHAGMSIEDVRKYERKLHDETNQKVLDGLEIPDSKPDT